MTENETDLAAQTRAAFQALTADQRVFIFRRTAASEHKHHYFATLFNRLNIHGFSRPQLAHTWVGALPQQIIEAFLLTEEGNERLGSLLLTFFTASYREMNDRFLEGRGDKEGKFTVSKAEECLARVRQEMGSDPFLALYEAAIRWMVMTDLDEVAAANEVQKQKPNSAAEDSPSTGEHGQLAVAPQTSIPQEQSSGVDSVKADEASPEKTTSTPSSLAAKRSNESPLVLETNPEPTVAVALLGIQGLSTVLSDLERLTQQAAELRVAELGAIATQLKKALERIPEIEAQLTASADRLQKKVALLTKVHWLSAFRPPEPVTAQPQAIVGDELRRMQQLDGKLARLVQIVERMTELEGRVEQPLLDWAPPAGIDLQEVIKVCELRIAEITERIEAAAAVEKTLVEFVDSFGMTDEDTGPHLLANVSPAEFCEVAVGILRQSHKPEASAAVGRLRGRVDIVGLILAHVWRKDATQALSLVQGAAGCESVIGRRVEAGKLFAFLSYTQMREAAERVSAWAPMVAELLFAGALGRNRPEVLEYLDPILDAQGIHPVCAAFYRTVVAAFHRGQLGTPRSWMEGDSVARLAADAERIAERQRLELLDYIRRTPGMVGYYHRLRVFARTKFLRPLEQAVVAGNAASALSQWEAYGGLDRMVEECAGAVEGRYSLDPTHFKQTRRYLFVFEEKLGEWGKRTTERQLPAGAVRPIRDAIAGLRRETGRGQKASVCCRSLLQLLERMAGGGEDAGIPAPDFGERCPGEGLVHADPDADAALVTPFMLQSWPGAVAQECVAVDELLHDWLRSATQEVEPPSDVVLRSYVRRGHIEAARRMGARREDWGRSFAVEIEGLTTAFRQKHLNLLAEAATAREVDRDISDCLVEIEKDLANARLSEAEEWIKKCLEGLLDVYRKRRDPVLCSLREFLAEAGQAANEDLGAEELRELIKAVRKEHVARRAHIDELGKAAQQTEWPLPLRAQWEQAATQLDRPRLWPEAGTATELGEAVRIFVRYLSRKMKWRESDPSTIDAIVEGLGDWVPARLAQGLAKGGGVDAEALKNVLQLAKDVDEDCPSAHVLQVVGVGRPSASPVPETPAKPVVEQPNQKEVVTIASEQLVSELRAEMRRLLPEADAGGKPDVTALRDALRRRDWSKAQALAACWLDAHADLTTSSPMNDTEAACMLSLAGGALTAVHDDSQERLWILGCLALGVVDLNYYLIPESQEEMAARLFARLAGQPDVEGGVGQTLKVALEGMDDLPSTELRSRPLAKMFRACAQLTNSEGGVVASRLARLLWNGLRMDTNYRPRASLLQLLFRLGHIGVIESLADTARPHQQLVVNCVRAFAHAESNPDARLHGLQLRKALEDRGGLRPWQLFMKQIDTGQAAQEEAAVTCRLESEFVTQEPNGRRTIELRLVPSLANPPQLLILNLGSESAKGGKVILQNEPLYGENTVTLEVPPAFQPSDGGVARIPFEITGQTIFEKPVQIRGAWEVKFDDKPAVPIPPEEITKAWPGASRAPVTRMKGFYGRDRELGAICAYVEALARPRSVMVFGQRRIGKTSLLKEAVASLDPDRHGVTGAFFDVSGLKFAADGSGMATAFFHYLTSQMRGSDNTHLRPWLSPEAQDRLEHRLAGLNPEVSLLDCFDTVAQHFGEASQGRVRRLALLIDEFDRFVEPLLSGHHEHVQQFLWNLRQVVQRAERVSLVLAGSGMQKLLKQDYNAALFGSIDEIQLEPFSWKEDKDAVLDTVFPADFRSRLCRPQEAEKLAEKACELCGGHPMFLAFLGSAAALLSRGRRLTPDFLNRVVERLVRDGVNEPCLQIRCKDFYAPTFQTLQRLPQRTRALAQLILVNVAERTTPDFAWESVANATAAEAVPPDVSRNEALEGMKRLEEDRVITWDRSRSRVRITVPLTAAALRQEVFLLRDEAIQLFESQGEL